MNPDPTSYIIKIELYKGCHVEEVVYYRYEVPHTTLFNYRWYFEYLAALVKVAHPKDKVNLLIQQIGTEDPFLAGKYYIEKKSKSLLAYKKGEVKRLQTKKFDDDLFSSKAADIQTKINKLNDDIEKLERGEVIFWFPPTYKNTIKNQIKPINRKSELKRRA